MFFTDTTNAALDFINLNEKEQQKRPKYMYYAGSYWAVIVTSILKTRSFEQVINVKGESCLTGSDQLCRAIERILGKQDMMIRNKFDSFKINRLLAVKMDW